MYKQVKPRRILISVELVAVYNQYHYKFRTVSFDSRK